MRLLVTGGAGYIGSHFAALASDLGHDVVIYDDFSTGHRWACKDREIIVGDILNFDSTLSALRGIDAVCHFASKIVVSESVVNPDEYYRVNVHGTDTLLRAMVKAGCSRLIFSSTAAVYGRPVDDQGVLDEASSTNPLNPYGISKLKAEKLIQQWALGFGGCATVFRYFNAAGCLPELCLGELHEPETHLIPNVIESLLNPLPRAFLLYGNDYETLDGSCVRDYIHVADIAEAHLRSLDILGDESGYWVMNLGSGCGYSNLQVIDECETQLEQKLDFVVAERRAGDPAVLRASNQLAYDLLEWQPQRSKLSQIVSDAITWHRDIVPLLMQ